MAVACGLSVLEIAEQEELLMNARVCGKLFEKSLRHLAENNIPIRNINVTGLCVSFEIIEEGVIRLGQWMFV